MNVREPAKVWLLVWFWVWFVVFFSPLPPPQCFLEYVGYLCFCLPVVECLPLTLVKKFKAIDSNNLYWKSNWIRYFLKTTHSSNSSFIASSLYKHKFVQLASGYDPVRWLDAWMNSEKYFYSVKNLFLITWGKNIPFWFLATVLILNCLVTWKYNFTS